MKGAELRDARVQLSACLVPRPDQLSVAAAVLRELAVSSEPMSAEQLCAALDPPGRPPAATIRDFLRVHSLTVFDQVRRGGFVLGRQYHLHISRAHEPGL